MSKKKAQVLESEDFPQHILDSINDIQEDNVPCDVQITVGERSFDAHKMVLAASSGYFKNMFSSGFKESCQSEIKIEGKDKVFDELLQFVYSGKLRLCPDTIFDVLSMAVYMQITAAFELINEYVSRTSSGLGGYHLPFEVVLNMALLTENSFKDKWLLQLNIQCHTVLGNGLEKFSKTRAFVHDITADFFEIYLDGEYVVNGSSENENKVLQAVVRWLKHDWEARKVHAYRLLKKVRLGFVSPEEINTLVDIHIRDIPECKDLVDGVLRILYKEKKEREARAATIPSLDDMRKDPRQMMRFFSEQRVQRSLPPAKPDLSVTYPEMFAVRSTLTNLVSIGGKGNKKSGASHFISEPKEMLNWGWNDFEYFDDLHKEQIHHHATIFVNGDLYLAGGTAHKDDDYRKKGPRVCQASLQRLITPDCEWRHLRRMNIARKNFAMVHVDGFIYAIGGENDNGLLNDVERYNMSCNKWEVQAPLLKKCSDISVIVLDGKLLVYGCCGKLSKAAPKTYMVQVFDASENKWHGALMENIPNSVKMTPAIVAYKGKCYRVIYPTAGKKKSSSTSKPMVNHLLVDFKDKVPVVVVGESQSQDLVPANTVGAFSIEADIFVNASGYIHKTGITIAEGQTHAVDLGPWVWLNHDADKEPWGSSHASVTCMTYDSFGALRCVRD